MMEWLLPKATKPFIPIQGTGIDAAPFLALFLLLLAASMSIVHWRARAVPPRLRFLIRLLACILFVFVVFFSHCFLKLAAFSLSRIGWDDLTAFNDLYKLIIPIGFTVLLGPIFCGWVCPFGFLQELIAKCWTAKTIPGRLTVLAAIGLGAAVFWRRFAPSTDVFTEMIPALWAAALVAILCVAVVRPALEPWLLKLRYVSLGAFVILATSVIFNEGWCALYINELDYAAVLACVVILAAAIAVPFGWCRYLCPTGVLFSWIGQASLIKGERRCTSACQLAASCEQGCRVKASEAHRGAAGPYAVAALP